MGCYLRRTRWNEATHAWDSSSWVEPWISPGQYNLTWDNHYYCTILRMGGDNMDHNPIFAKVYDYRDVQQNNIKQRRRILKEINVTLINTFRDSSKQKLIEESSAYIRKRLVKNVLFESQVKVLATNFPEVTRFGVKVKFFNKFLTEAEKKGYKAETVLVEKNKDPRTEVLTENVKLVPSIKNIRNN